MEKKTHKSPADNQWTVVGEEDSLMELLAWCAENSSYAVFLSLHIFCDATFFYDDGATCEKSLTQAPLRNPDELIDSVS